MNCVQYLFLAVHGSIVGLYKSKSVHIINISYINIGVH